MGPHGLGSVKPTAATASTLGTPATTSDRGHDSGEQADRRGVVRQSDPEEVAHKADGVLVITTNRAQVHDAVNGAAGPWPRPFDQLDADDDLAAGVLTGGGVTFSAGMALKPLALRQTDRIRRSDL